MSIPVAGVKGIPASGSGLTAVAMTLSALNGSSTGGSAVVWPDGTAAPATTSINYVPSNIHSNTVIAQVGANGKIRIKNNGANPIHFILDLQGWYTSLKAPTISCDGDYAAGAWVTNPGDGADGVLCRLSAPAASSSDQTLQLNVNGVPQDSFTLSETSTSNFTTMLYGLTGKIALEAFLTDSAADGPVSAYEFGVGAWSQESLSPSVPHNSVTEPGTAVLTPLSPRTGLLPSDSQISYVVTDLTAGTTLTVPATGNEPAVLTDLPRGHTFGWSAKIRALTSWTTTTQVQTETWRFRVANEGETVPSNEPAEDSSASTSTTGGTSSQASAAVVPNGCTLSPDRWGNANFRPACDKHDICYGSKMNRKDCDLQFRTNLMNICIATYKPGFKRNNCA
ncbi:hypothetical protein [Frigoribacterium faeni]|uniref:Phospholipase A2 n=1 Tax=Frigoribacterium faeni TaxID=145483 RepID=A0A7W3JIX9_9MICO|nr:hypothetical protein [Frigoribacterium faeni]MBA8813707.1 hypothetical protein [Frigoribacterium faeni]BFF15000.1 hypothetical protein GCM10025699_63030 [Microbacterium flavescens]GEK83353.1 hypothetical protein FFA01_16620 [Frigoribacterium faeni]